MTSSDQLQAKIENEARHWLMRQNTGAWSDADRRALAAWRAADPRHEAAWRNAETLWSNLSQWEGLAALEPLEDRLLRERVVALVRELRAKIPLHIPHIPRPAALAAMTGLLLFAMIGGVIGFLGLETSGQRQIVAQEVTTRVAEVREITLPDETVVTLGAKTSLEITYTKAARRVTLAGGDAFFSVRRDPERPFVVRAGETEIRVVGTKFDVHRGPEHVRVSVLEGVVEVTRPQREKNEKSGRKEPPATVHVLTAGHQIVASKSGAFDGVRSVGIDRPGAWRDGRLVYIDASLFEVVADANRYFDGRIELASAELGDLRLTASFRTDQIDQMLHTLASALPVVAERHGPDLVVLRPAPESR